MSKLNHQTHAVVIGASMAGLLAARVLTDYFDRVTIIERDRLPETPEHRNGVPQAHHAHAMLVRGRQIISELFPGLDAELLAAGAPEIDHGWEVLSLFKTGWAPRIQSGVKAIGVSRDFLETSIRRRMSANPKVTIHDNIDVTGLLTDETRARVAGVSIQPRGTGEAATIEADLVLEAGGRSSKLPDWLEAIGYTGLETEVINAHSGYASRWYEIPEDFQADWKSLLLQPSPPVFGRGGVLIPVEGKRWSMTLFGTAKDYPPTEEEAFMSFARSLPTPVLYNAIKAAQPITPIYGFRRLENQLRHYEKMVAFPDGLMVMGDAYVALNPTYAQGMTVASLSAMTLNETLQKANGQFEGVGRTFQQQLSKTIAGPWQLTISEDLRWPSTEGGKVDGPTRIMHWYSDQVMSLIPDNPEMYAAFINVMHVLDSPAALFAPRIAAKVLRHALKNTQAPKITPFPQTRWSHV